MQAVQIISPGQTRFIETPRPKRKVGHALIRPLLLSLCSSDIWKLHHAPPEDYPFPPGVTGHEMVGVVEAVDAPGSDIQAGDVALVLVPGSDAMCEYFLAPVEDILTSTTPATRLGDTAICPAENDKKSTAGRSQLIKLSMTTSKVCAARPAMRRSRFM